MTDFNTRAFQLAQDERRRRNETEAVTEPTRDLEEPSFSARIYDLAQRERERDRADANLSTPPLQSPEMAARARRDAAVLGAEIPSDELTRSAADAARARRLLTDAPRLNSWYANPRNAEIARDDVGALSFWEIASRSARGDPTVWNEVLASNRYMMRGIRQIRISELIERQNPESAMPRINTLLGREQRGALSPEEETELARLLAADPNLPASESIPDIVSEYTPIIIAGLGASFENSWRQLRRSIQQSGQDIERSTTPLGTIEAAANAPFAAVAGTIAGFPTGASAFMYEQEAGAAFQEYRNFVDENGNRLDPQIAGAYARDVGLINAGIEFLGLGAAAKVSGAGEVLQAITRPGVRAALRRLGYREATRRLAVGVGGAALTEGFTELTQEGVTMALGQLAQQAQGGEWAELTDEEIAERAWTSFRAGAILGGAFGAIPSSARFIDDLSYARQARERAEMFAAFGDAAQASALRKRSPGAFADAVDQMVANGPIAEVSISAEQFDSVFRQEGEDPEAIAEALRGVGGETFREALEAGTDIKIPMGTYASQIIGTQFEGKLGRHVRMGPDELTTAEVEARLTFGEDLEGMAAEMTRLQRQAAQTQERVADVEDRIAAQFERSGYIPQAQRAFVRALSEAIVTQATRLNVSPSQMLDRVGFQLRSSLDEGRSPTPLRDGLVARLDALPADAARNAFPRDKLAVARPQSGGEPVGYFTLDAARDIATADGSVRGEAGDVVVVQPDGSMRPISPEAFAAEYAPINEAAPAFEQTLAPWMTEFVTEAQAADLVEMLGTEATPEEILAHPVIAAIEANATQEPTMTLEQAANLRTSGNRYQIDGRDLSVDEYVEHMIERSERKHGVEIKREKLVVISTGQPGAGKSTTNAMLTRAYGAAAVDLDEMRLGIPAFDGGRGSSVATQAEAGALSRLVADRYVADGKNIVHEAVGADEQKIVDMVVKYRALGYRVVLANVSVDFEQSVRRYVLRTLTTGRYVHSSFILSVRDAPRSVFATLLEKGDLDGYIQVDGNGPQGSENLLTAQGAAVDPDTLGRELRQRSGSSRSGRDLSGDVEGDGFNQDEVGDNAPDAGPSSGGSAYLNYLKETGFNVETPFYRGMTQPRDGDRFTASLMPGNVEQGRGVSLAEHPGYASEYAAVDDGGVVYPVFVRGQLGSHNRFNQIVQDAYASNGGDARAALAVAEAEFARLGYVGWRGSGRLRGEVKVFDPDNIADRFGQVPASITPNAPDGSPSPAGALPDGAMSALRGELRDHGFDVPAQMPDLPQIEVPLSDLRLGQIGSLDRADARSYATLTTDAPPILVRRQGRNGWHIIDGNRRAEAARLRGDQNVRVIDATGLFDNAPARGPSEGFEYFQRGAKGSVAFRRDERGLITESVMRLFDGRNLSTPIHEMGHIFLELLRMVALDPNAPASAKKDWQTALDWMGVTDEKWADYSTRPLAEATDLLRPYHEKWARGFEAYAREGNAPSMALREVFHAFKRWLTYIYKAVTQLRVTLTPEIRDVFDRLLATEEAIAEAKQASGASAPMTREQFGGRGKQADAAYRRYVTQFQRAEMEATEAVDKAAMTALYADRTRDWRKREREIRAGVEASFNERPEQRAIDWLAYGLHRDGKPPEGLPPMRLAPASVIAEYGEDMAGRLPSGVIAPDIDGLTDEAIEARKTLNARPPVTLSQKVRLLGGIRPDDPNAGDVSLIEGRSPGARGALVAEAQYVRRGKETVRVPARTIDDMIVALWEDGFFGEKPEKGTFAQGGTPRSLREAVNLTDEEVIAWYNANVEIRRPSDGSVSLWFRTEDGLARPNVRVSIQSDGLAITSFRGRTSGERYIPNAQDVKKAAQIFVRVAAVTRAYILLNKPERIVFSGATEAHERLYRTMLRLTDFPGYVSQEHEKLNAQAYKATDDVTPVRSAPSTQNSNTIFVIARADIADAVNEQVLTTGFAARFAYNPTERNVGTINKSQTRVRTIRDGRQADPNGRASGSAASGRSGDSGSPGGVADGDFGTAFNQAEQPDLNEFLDALQRDLRGESIYRLDDHAQADSIRTAKQLRDWFAQNGVDINTRKRADLRAQVEKMAARVDDNGVDADTAARWFGFESGRDMLDAMIAAPARAEYVKTETRKRLIDEFGGDPFADGTIAEEAVKAMHGARRAKVIEIELDTIDRATDGQFRPVDRAARDIAKARVDRMNLTNIRRYNWFLAQERREAQSAARALEKGEYQAAREAKYRQLVNHHLYELARKASEEMDVSLRYLKKFTRPGVRQNIENGYLDQIDQLLDQYELKRLTGPQIEERINLTTWAQRMEASGRGHLIAVDPRILERSRRQSFQRLELDEARGLVETIKNIEHLGRLKEKLLDADDKRSFAEVITEAVDAMNATGPVSDKVKENYSDSRLEGAATELRKWNAQMTRMEFLFRYLDGKANGPIWRALWQPFAKAADKEAILQRQAAETMQTIWNRYASAERGRMFKTKIPMYDLPVGAATHYTKAELIAIALNIGNEGNLRALVDGFGWGKNLKARGVDIDYAAARQQIVRSLNRVLDERDWQTVQTIWDHIASYRDEAFALQEELTGVRPEAVASTSVTTPYGVLAGGYYPLKFDGQRDLRQAKADEAQAVQDMMGSNWSKPMTKKGHLINRVGSGGRPVKLNLNVFAEHIQNVTHDIAYRKAILDADRIMQDPRFAEAFIRVAGREMYDQLRPWLQGIAADRADPTAFFWQLLQKMRGNVAIAAMGYRLSTSLQQLVGLLQAVPHLGSAEMAGALAKLVSNPMEINAKAEWIRTKSEFMRNRLTTFDRDVRETLDRMERNDPLHPIRDHAFTLVGMFDFAVSSVVWMAAYEKALSGNVNGIDGGVDADAVAYADQAVRTTQSAGLQQDLPAIMRGNQTNKLMTMFFSYFSVLYNWTAYDQVLGVRKQRISKAAFVGNMALIYIISPLIAEALAGRWEPREDETDEERNARLAGVVIRFPFATVPFIRDIANAAGTGFEYQLSPVGSAPGSIIRAGENILEGRAFETEATTKGVVTAAGYLFGLPTPQAWIPIDYFADKLEGEEPGFDPYEAFVRDSR